MEFLRSIFEEDDGKASFSRIFTGIFILAIVGVVIYATIKKGDVPELQGLGIFVPGTVTALYGFNKISTAIGK